MRGPLAELFWMKSIGQSKFNSLVASECAPPATQS